MLSLSEEIKNMKKIEEQVKDDVIRLLSILKPQVSKDSEDFRFVSDKLTKMVILSVPPAGCRTNACR